LTSTPAWRTCAALAFFKVILKMIADDVQSISQLFPERGKPLRVKMDHEIS
jgi:hypothetical protein